MILGGDRCLNMIFTQAEINGNVILASSLAGIVFLRFLQWTIDYNSRLGS